jgi:hypothetical protein
LDSNRYGVLAVTVLAVLIAAIAAALTRNSWADKTTSKSSGLSVRLRQQTSTTFGSPSTTFGNVSTTVALPVPSTSSTARGGTTLTTKPATVPTIGSTPTSGTTPTTRGSTTSTTKVPPGSYDQRSDNDATFAYPQGASSQGPTSSKGPLAYIVKGEVEGGNWHLTTDVRNNSGREVRFDGGIDTVVHLLCDGKSSDQHLANPGVTTMPAGGGVILQADMQPLDTGRPSGNCTLYGTIHYSTV